MHILVAWFQPGRVADLPIAGWRVMLMLRARRFRSEAVRWGGASLLNASITTFSGFGRGARLGSIRSSLVLRSPWRPTDGEFCAPLKHAVSNDTLLRVVVRRCSQSFATPEIIGIDD